MVKIETNYTDGSQDKVTYTSCRTAVEQAFRDFLSQVGWDDTACEFHCTVVNDSLVKDPERDYGTPTEDPSEFFTPELNDYAPEAKENEEFCTKEEA